MIKISKTYYKGEVRTFGIKVKRGKKEPFVIEEASCTIQNNKGVTIQEGRAFPDGDIVQFQVDTTIDGFTDERGNSYDAWFRVLIAYIGEVLLGPIKLKILPGKVPQTP